MKYSYQERLEVEARLANKHPINREAQRWRKERALADKERFWVTPMGVELQVDNLLRAGIDKKQEQGTLGPELADAMRWELDELPLSPIERLRWWRRIPGEDPSELARLLKEANELEEAMTVIVEAFDSNLRADSDRNGGYDPMGTLH